MNFGYVVLYVNNPEESLRFWLTKLGMQEKGQKQIGQFSIVRVGFPDQDFSLELVPLDLMKNNPDNLDLATPSLALYVDDLEETRIELLAKGVEVTELADRGGIKSFAFVDNERRAFAVLES